MVAARGYTSRYAECGEQSASFEVNWLSREWGNVQGVTVSRGIRRYKRVLVLTVRIPLTGTPYLLAMVSLSDISGSDRFMSEECDELSVSSSIVLQSSMVKGWEKVLRRRAVAHLRAARSSPSHAFRLIKMSEGRDLVLAGKEELSVLSPELNFFRSPVSFESSNSGGDSEDDLLAPRVVVLSGFKLSTFGCPEKKEGSLKGESSVSEGSECESASGEGSESYSDDEDKIIYLGRENLLARVQSGILLPFWLVPVVFAVAMVSV